METHTLTEVSWSSCLLQLLHDLWRGSSSCNQAYWIVSAAFASRSMARTVADAAVLLSFIAGPDPADPATADAAEATQRLRTLTLDNAPTLTGTRLAVVRGE